MSKNKEKTTEELLHEALVPVEEQPYPIPENWVWVRFGLVAQLINGFAFKSSDYCDEGIPVIRISNIKGNNTTSEDAIKVPYSFLDEKFLIRRGDMLIAMSGATTGKTGIYNSDEIALQNQRVGNIKEINERVLYRGYKNYFVSKSSDDILKMAYGGAQPNISGKMIESIAFPLPPINEQKRIADKVERLMNKINQAKQLIEEAKETFELRRAAILDKAFRGELTLNKQYIKSDIVLNIGKGVAIDDGKSEELRLHLLKNSPKSWGIHSLGSILRENTGICYGIVQTGNDTPNGIPTVRAGDLKNDYFEVDNLKKVDPAIESNYPRSRLRGDELLISIRGSVGYVGIPTTEMNGINVSREVGVIPLNKSVQQKFLAYYIQSPLIQGFLKKITKGVAQQGINLNQLRTLPVPIPSILEQEDIVNELDSLFAKEKKVNQELLDFNTLDMLSNSILSRALRGELGTNELNDESAASLLIDYLHK